MDYFDWYAAYLHRTCPVVDAHLDLVTEVYRRRLTGETGVLTEYYKKEFQKSGVNLVFASLFLGRDELEGCKENGIFPKGVIVKKALKMLAAFYADLEETKGRMQLVTDKESLFRITAKRGLPRQHRVGIVLYLEGLDMLEGEPELLRCFYAMGIRGAALAWNERAYLPNAFAKGCSSEGGMPETEKGREYAGGMHGQGAITDKGVEALLLMEKLGIFVDSSHLSREAAWLLPSFTKKPFAATHSNADALLEHKRNLMDEEIKEIAGRGGVIGVNAYREFLMKEKTEKPAASVLCEQILYLVKLAGEDYVGFGLDLGEGCVLTSYRELPKITAELLRRGCSVEAVKKILGGNWIRYLLQILK